MQSLLVLLYCSVNLNTFCTCSDIFEDQQCSTWRFPWQHPCNLWPDFLPTLPILVATVVLSCHETVHIQPETIMFNFHIIHMCLFQLFLKHTDPNWHRGMPKINVITLGKPSPLAIISEKHLSMISLHSLNGGSNVIFGSSTLSLIIITCFMTYRSSSNSSPKSFPFCNNRMLSLCTVHCKSDMFHKTFSESGVQRSVNTFQTMNTYIMYFKEVKEITEGVDDHTPQLIGHQGCDTREEKLGQFSGISIILGNQVLPFLLLIYKCFGTCWNPSEIVKYNLCVMNSCMSAVYVWFPVKMNSHSRFPKYFMCIPTLLLHQQFELCR